jgi:disulfide oxidoreductase YuzD
MKNTVKILTPMIDCRKTQKIVRYLECILTQQHIEAEIIQETNFETIKQYQTWLLPTVIINEKVVARGYKPPLKEILKYINT